MNRDKPQVHTVSEMIAEFGNYGSDPAVISSKKMISYKNIIQSNKIIKDALAENIHSITTGRIGILVFGKTTFCSVFYGISNCGFSAMLLPTDAPASKLNLLLDKYRADALIVDKKGLQVLKEMGIDHKNPVLVIDDSSDEPVITGLFPNKGKKASHNCEKVTPDSEAVIVFTSGTSGLAKAVIITHRNLIETGNMINDFMRLKRPILEFVTVPLMHAFGFRRILCNHLIGGAIMVEDGFFNPARILKLIRNNNCEGMSGVPAVFRIFKGRFKDALIDLSPMIKFIEIGSAPLSKMEKEELCDIFTNAEICMHYGLTEASKVSFLNFHREKGELSTIGKPSPGVSVKIVDEYGVDVPNGQAGEIWASGFNVASSYLMDSKLTEDSFHDRWFKTGDLGIYDQDGYITLIGRRDDMLNVGGKKMNPLEIENYIRDLYPAIDLAITGYDDDLLGTVPILCYDKTTAITDELFESMLTQLKGVFEDYKLPCRKLELEKIPKTENGKILRESLNKISKGCAKHG